MSEVVRELHGVARPPRAGSDYPRGAWRVEVVTIRNHGIRGTRYAAQATHLETGATCGWDPDSIFDQSMGQKHRAQKWACRLYHMCRQTPFSELPPSSEMYPQHATLRHSARQPRRRSSPGGRDAVRNAAQDAVPALRQPHGAAPL